MPPLFATRALRAILAALCATLVAQEPPSPKLTANADEVMVDIVARDKKGKLVRDLQPEEIEITDDGAPTKLKALRFVSGGAQPQTPTPAAGTREHTIRLVSLVFEHLSPDAGRLARETTDEMLKSEAGAELYFAVLTVDHRLRMVQQYTNDRALLRRAIDSVTLGPKTHTHVDVDAAENTVRMLASGSQSGDKLAAGDLSQTAATDMLMASMMVNALRDAEQISRDMQARPSLAGLLALVQQQGSLPGRKAIVYFSEGLPLTANAKQIMRTVVESANRSNAAIYAVDVAGVSMTSRTEAGRQMLAAATQASQTNMIGSGPGPAVPGAPAGVPTNSDYGPRGVTMSQVKAGDKALEITASDSQGSLMDLAKGTGGLYLGDSNDLRKPARKLIEDVASYYEAAYVPDTPKYDIRFHPIVVKVKRPGVTVQARSGYMALPPGTPRDVQPFEAALLRALAAPELKRELEFRPRVVRFSRNADNVSASLVLELPLHQMEFREDATNKTFELHPTILVLLKDESGRVVNKFSQDLPYRGALEVLDRMRENAYTFQRSFIARPGKYSMEVAVSDALGGRIGAERSSITISDAPAGAGLSEISLVRRYEALPESAAATEPFRYQNSRIVPSSAHTISKTATPAVSTFFVIYPDPKSTDKPKLELELTRNNEMVASIPMELPATASTGPIPYVASIPTAVLRPGPHELTAIVTQGSQVVRQEVSFVIEGPEPAVATTAVAASEAPAAGSNLPPTTETVAARAPVVITKIDNANKPDAEEQKRVIDVARKRALEYSDTLPNFTCIQTTRRLVDRTGQKRWQAKDTIAELLRFQDKQELRQTLEVNGQKLDTSRSSFGGVLSTGEFGGLMKAVFDPKVQAEFTWKDMASLGNQTTHVFTFHVAIKNSSYALRTGPHGNFTQLVAFHGEVFIDTERYAVRRISIEAENVPKTFPVQESMIAVDYDLVAVGDQDYVLPQAAELQVRMGKRSLVRNESEFRDYRRFGAKSTIQFVDDPPKQ